jgi:hypothetical protein
VGIRCFCPFAVTALRFAAAPIRVDFGVNGQRRGPAAQGKLAYVFYGMTPQP